MVSTKLPTDNNVDYLLSDYLQLIVHYSAISWWSNEYNNK